MGYRIEDDFELPKINVSFEYDEEKDEIVFVINGVEKRVKTEDMITEMEKLQEQNTALEQQPCEDCISRKEVLDLVEDMTDQFGVGHRVITEGVISMLPPVTPKPMQVDLEGDGYADNGQIYYDYGKCPKCGWDFEYGDKDWEEPYCCHCGQRLKWFESEDKE